MLTSTWSLVVTVLTLANILGCLWLLAWTMKKRPNEAPEGQETGHVWDEDLREYNNPMPRWWLNLFVVAVIFALGYLLLYPGLGNFGGLFGWTTVGQHDARLAKVVAQRDSVHAQYEGREIAELIATPSAVALGAKIFANNCAGCHGTDAKGAIGFPNLVDGDWIYGGSPEAVLQTLANGRGGMMPPLAARLKDDLPLMVKLLLDWDAARQQPQENERILKKFKGLCASCHGLEGKGNPVIGAPNLSDDIWLYGGSAEAIEHTLVNGRQGMMPAFQTQLSDTERRLVAAWVLSHQGQ